MSTVVASLTSSFIGVAPLCCRTSPCLASPGRAAPRRARPRRASPWGNYLLLLLGMGDLAGLLLRLAPLRLDPGDKIAALIEDRATDLEIDGSGALKAPCGKRRLRDVQHCRCGGTRDQLARISEADGRGFGIIADES